MIVYLADTSSSLRHRIPLDLLDGASILQSFYYCDEWTESIIPRLKRFMLDSGAFTFLSSGGVADWDSYVRKYAEFINRNSVTQFFELDIDSLVGYEKVKYYRAMLEEQTGRKCIPVWHKSRGHDEFLRMCEEYDYVAIGGIVTKEITRKEHKIFPHFIGEAHKRGAKIHGLGFTTLASLPLYHFDSVDSTSWVSGNRFGYMYRFKNGNMEKVVSGTGRRLTNVTAAAQRNFIEWRRFGDYAERYL